MTATAEPIDLAKFLSILKITAMYFGMSAFILEARDPRHCIKRSSLNESLDN